ncbi:MAG: hypothetical protein GY758_27310 [Fuerstiella sp.]|jgi:hypothetical protein|nr:hypothetical protein [Fuerstiella sp.]MCP4510914.1 hypothetical protein [Fuerstiella sp.]
MKATFFSFTAVLLCTAVSTANAFPLNNVVSDTINGDGSSKVIKADSNGGFTVSQVKVGNTVLTENVDYTVQGDGSSKPTIKLTSAPAVGDVVTVTGTNPNSDPTLDLDWQKSILYKAERLARMAGKWWFGLYF